MELSPHLFQTVQEITRSLVKESMLQLFNCLWENFFPLNNEHLEHSCNGRWYFEIVEIFYKSEVYPSKSCNDTDFIALTALIKQYQPSRTITIHIIDCHTMPDDGLFSLVLWFVDVWGMINRFSFYFLLHVLVAVKVKNFPRQLSRIKVL